MYQESDQPKKQSSFGSDNQGFDVSRARKDEEYRKKFNEKNDTERISGKTKKDPSASSLICLGWDAA